MQPLLQHSFVNMMNTSVALAIYFEKYYHYAAYQHIQQLKKRPVWQSYNFFSEGISQFYNLQYNKIK